MATTYDYPVNGAYNETIATMDNGRQYVVNTQYATVHPIGKHHPACAQLVRMGGQCDCGLLTGINVETLVADARKNGKRGYAPKPAAKPESSIPESKSVCPHCHTYCDGDCQS